MSELEMPCGTCGKDVRTPRQWLACREHFVADIKRLKLEIDGLERFKNLRLKHNDEMKRRTIQLAYAEGERDRALACVARLEGTDDGHWTDTLCTQCGPSIAIDEDGCCQMCGLDAVGPGVEAVMLWRRERDRLKDALAEHMTNMHALQSSMEEKANEERDRARAWAGLWKRMAAHLRSGRDESVPS